MKKKNLFLKFVTFAAVLMAASCDDGLADLPVGQVKNALTVDEAEAYFEQTMMQVPVTRGTETKLLVPNDFTPEWSQGVSTSYGNVSCLNVPINSFVSYKASYKQNGVDEVVKIAQKLIVIKNTDTGEKAQFLVSIIPCYGYAAEHHGEDIAELFVQGGSKNGFSGIALYIVPETGVVFQVSTYINGRRTASANCYSDAATKARLTKAAKRLKFYEVVPTRAGGEDIFGNPMLGDWFNGSYWLPEITVTPGGNSSADHGEGEWIGNGTTDPIDPPSTNHDDLDDNCSHCHDGEQCVGGGGIGTVSSEAEKHDYSQVKRKMIPYSASKYPGYLNTVEWNGKMVTLDCLGVAKMIMDDLGLAYEIKRVQLWKEDKNFVLQKVIKDDDAAFKALVESAVEEIIRHIDANRPMIVGINHSPGSPGNLDDTTDHFVLITGYGYGYCEEDGKDELYFIYIETGRKKINASEAVSGKTVLYYNEDTGEIHGKKQGGDKDYQLVQIRPNF